MVCNNCGNQVQEGQQFCTVCGSPVSSVGQYNQMNYEQPQNAQQNAYGQSQNGQQNVYGQSQYTQQNAYGQSQNGQQNAYGQSQNGQQNTYGQSQYTQQNVYQRMMQDTYVAPVNHTEQGMKWFKFIIWVQLFLNAILNLREGITALTGAQYDGMAERVYRFYENLKIYDTIYGVAVILLAAYAIWVRFKLSGFKKDGPMMYFICLGANIVIPLIYVALASGEIGVSMGDVLSNGSSTTIVGSIIMLVVNIVYFKNRKHLFVN